MKTRRLPEIDLARFCVVPPGPQLDQALRTYNASGGSWSYDPVRGSTLDIVGASTPLLGAITQPDWKTIERKIRSACRMGEVQAKANIEVGKVLFDAARSLRWSAVTFSMGRLPIGIGETVRYWSDLLLADKEGPFIPFFDHRRAHGVASASVRQIVFSMQHLWVRERCPDVSEARLAIIRFPSIGETRSIRIDFHDGAELLPYEELDERVRTVYESWARVSVETARDPRKRSGGNPFGF